MTDRTEAVTTMTFKPVIHVGIDGAWRDAGAVEWAVQEALLRRAALRAVHVIDDRALPVPDELAIDVVNAVGKYLDERLGALDHHGCVAIGSPARTLVSLAAESRMLVVGRRGTDAVRDLMIGSLSEAVAISGTVPVIVVPQQWTPTGRGGPVVVAIDGSDCGSPAVDFAVETANLRKLPLRLVHVWDLPAIYPGDVPSMGEEWWDTAERRLEHLADGLRGRHPDLLVETELRSGHAAAGIVTAATEADAQLLVIGGCARDWPSKLPDSITCGVLRHAGCPLAVVHHREG
ncbi:universal stress protein [Kribbella shirazensis]|uniref:Nucleotide-binding universal stress UspA family protein n=1 Tax=Kribbella shirazensis TaxID=1105143 RepID=A0A7X5VEM1_9ACTN|nr:universal stress protein [Kribbella shirazensis]NIK59137.1 nucleotide-binding universal stress UspA family protein [Kribbella shirazensis]